MMGGITMILGSISEKDSYSRRGLESLDMLLRLYGSLKEMNHRAESLSLTVDEVPAKYHRPITLTRECNSRKCEEIQMVLSR